MLQAWFPISLELLGCPVHIICHQTPLYTQDGGPESPNSETSMRRQTQVLSSSPASHLWTRHIKKAQSQGGLQYRDAG